MGKMDVVYTLVKAGYSKEEIANLMGGDTAPETAATPETAAAPAAPEASAAPKASEAQAKTPDTHDELMALRNRLKVLETVLSVSNTDNADSLASIVYPKGE